LYIAHTQNIGNRLGETSLALLAHLLLAALQSQRQQLICDPFPLLFENRDAHLLHPEQRRDVALATQLCQDLVNNGLSAATDQRLGYWLMVSTKSYIVEQLEHPFKPHQLFLVLASSPDEEQRFLALKQKHGSTYAFHGSPLENFHSIIHNGLKNASGTRLQLNGAAYGPGIYLSPSSATSGSYSRWYNTGYASGSQLCAMAIVEVINSGINRHGAIWVQPDASMVQIRFLLVGKGALPIRDTADLKPALDQMSTAFWQ
jgi:hypothetical protein